MVASSLLADTFGCRATELRTRGAWTSTRNTMINNDVLRSVRYMLDLSDALVIETIQRVDAQYALSVDQVRAYLSKEDEPGHVECPDAVLVRFLDGLILHLRGPSPNAAARPLAKRRMCRSGSKALAGVRLLPLAYWPSCFSICWCRSGTTSSREM